MARPVRRTQAGGFAEAYCKVETVAFANINQQMPRLSNELQQLKELLLKIQQAAQS